MSKKYFQNEKGFTIIEMMISIAIFLIVVTIGMTALLNADSIHNKLQATRSTLDSLNFMMDDMSRNIRTGYDYHCFSGNDPFDSTDINPLSCPRNASALLPGGWPGYALSFKSPNPSGGVSQIIYYFDNTTGNLEKSTDGGQTFTILNPDGVVFSIKGGNSGTYFWVSGAENESTNDNLQPFVTIILNGTITSKGVVTPFALQTSVSQRKDDI